MTLSPCEATFPSGVLSDRSGHEALEMVEATKIDSVAWCATPRQKRVSLVGEDRRMGSNYDLRWKAGEGLEDENALPYYGGDGTTLKPPFAERFYFLYM
ncbi:hypothetical protein KM043_001019 [Ampulex compressa]|nr:hypothetical protein KM043_001019 [Ampulex compressa]